MTSPDVPSQGDQVLVQYEVLAALQEREHDLAEAQRLARLGSWTWDLGRDVVTWSDELYRIFGVGKPMFTHTFEGFLSLVHPDDRSKVEQAVRAALVSEVSFSFEHRLATDELSWVRGSGDVDIDGDGIVVRMHGTAQEITEEVSVRGTLAELRRRSAALELASTASLVTLYGSDENIAFSTAPSEYTCGLTASESYGVSERDLIHGDDVAHVNADLARLRASPGASIVSRYRSANTDGSWRTVEAWGTNATGDPNIQGMLVCLHELDGESAGAEPGHVAASRDPLAGLANHAQFLAYAEQTVVRARRCAWGTAILVIDIDGFRDLNEAWGDVSGDMILAEVAARLELTFGTSDVVGRVAPTAGHQEDAVARLGGDRFHVVCENVADPDAARAVGERVNRLMASPVLLAGGEQIRVSVGIGIAIVGPTERSIEHRIRDAEDALLSAKRGGHGRCVVVAEGHPTDEEVYRDAVRALRHALDADELVLHYQPKLSLESDRITGVEALVRWQDSARGLVPPLEFIPLAEETGLIIPLGSWVIEEACRQAAAWQSSLPRQPPLVVAVNVSGVQFTPNLIPVVAAALTASGAAANQLCLEVTESILMTDADAAAQTLDGLAALGVKLSIDDFGTGYSSLSYLKRFPLHELKIDKSFIDGVGSDADDTAIVAATVAMAHALGLSVIAEGVESADQLDRLGVIGCQEVQGYLVSRPQAAELITEFLHTEAMSGWRSAIVHAPATPMNPYRPNRILVVDDTDDVRQLAKIALTVAGFDVYEAVGGAEAIEIARDLQPDCVILDISMPKMSGIEVCRRLRDDPTTTRCTILMLTSNTAAVDKIEAFSSGADDYIIKPFSPRALVDRVQAALRRAPGDAAVASES